VSMSDSSTWPKI